MTGFWTTILGDKKTWRAMEARARLLPADHQVVYGEMKPYLWRFASGDGMDVVAVLKGVLDLFEAAAAQGKGVLEVTGPDVAAFCDERLRGNATSFVDTWRSRLNRGVTAKLAE